MAQAQEVFLFSPTQISGCQVWLDGADPNANGTIPANGATVSTWVDKSGLGNTATAVGTITFSNSSLAYNTAAGTYFYGNTSNTTTSLTLFTVCLVNTLGSGRWLFSSSSANNIVSYDKVSAFVIATTGSSFRSYRNNTSLSLQTLPIGSSFIQSQLFDGVNNTNFLNGTGASSVGSTGNFNLLVYNLGTSIGEQAAVTFDGRFQEVIMYSSALSTSQRQQIEGYLAWKWGLQANLPSSHPFKSYRPLANTPIPISVPAMPIRVQTTLPYNPTQISGCQIWVDAADPASMTFSSGSNLQSWANKATASSVFTRGGTADRVVYTSSNGLPLVSFNSDGSTSNAWLTGSVSLTANTSFLQVITPISYSVGTWSFYWSWQWNNAGDRVPGLRSSNVNNDFQPYITWVGNNNNRISITNGTSYLSFVEFTGGGANTRYSINGNTPTGGAISASNINSSVFILGGDGNNGATVWGKNYLSEMIMYSNVLTTQQRQQLEGYLAWKWNLTASLPTGHPYKMTPYIQFPSRVLPFNGNLGQWIPTRISGCSLWLDSADQTTFTFSGSNLTQWRDKSTTAAIFTGSTPAPVLSASRYGSNIPVSFGGTSYFQNTTFPYTTSSRSAFFVYDETTEQNNVGILSFASSGTDYSQSNTMVYETGFKVSSQYLQLVQNNQAIQFQTTTIGFALYSDTFSSNLESAYVNGSFVKATTFTGPFSNSTGLVIGARMLSGSIGNYLIGVIGEVVLFNRPLLTAERQQVEGYLAWKWGLVASLPANHPFKLFPPSP